MTNLKSLSSKIFERMKKIRTIQSAPRGRRKREKREVIIISVKPRRTKKMYVCINKVVFENSSLWFSSSSSSPQAFNSSSEANSFTPNELSPAVVSLFGSLCLRTSIAFASRTFERHF
jgi:hypothetical protein